MRQESDHKLRWTAEVAHVAVERLDAHITVGLGGGRGSTSTPECMMELWAWDSQGEELVYCRARAMRRQACEGEVIWLGGSPSRPACNRVRGWRCVAASSACRGQNRSKWLTIAEALLGVTSALLCLFGVGTVELEVMDDGSGGLARWYAAQGFSRVVHSAFSTDKGRKNLWMAAPADIVAQENAPSAWLNALVPADFDALAWLKSEVSRNWLDRIRLGRLPRWSWIVAWPHRAELHMEVSQCRGIDGEGCLLLSSFLTAASVRMPTPSQLVGCRCMLTLQRSTLTVLWMGRGDSQAANAAVRGRKVYATCCHDASHGHEVPNEGMVTCVVAQLGALAVVAGWFGATTVSIRAHDSGSGSLVRYLRSLGFVSESTGTDEETSERHLLHAPCDYLAQHCCPLDWQGKLLESEDLNRFSTVSLNRAQLILEDARQDRERVAARASSTKNDKQEQRLARSSSDVSLSKQRRSKVILEPLPQVVYSFDALRLRLKSR